MEEGDRTTLSTYQSSDFYVIIFLIESVIVITNAPSHGNYLTVLSSLTHEFRLPY